MTYWRQKRRIMKRYDRSAYVYDEQYCEEQEVKIKAAVAEVDFGKADVVIDVGCGTGQLLPYVANMVQLVIDVDVSRKLIAQAKARSQRSMNVALLRADADYLPFIPCKFDKVFAFTLLQNMPHPNRTLNEMKRIAKGDALLVVTGLRKSFSERQFVQLLKQAGFEISSLKLDAAQRDYIAVLHYSLRKP